MSDALTFDLIKLGLQFLGALVIARLAVMWALRRYKSEKTWERRMAAYVDAVEAIGEMRRIIGQWLDEIESGNQAIEEIKADRRKRYWDARRRFDITVAVASMTIPGSGSAIMQKLEKDLLKVDEMDRHDGHEREYELLSEALEALTESGRKNLF